VKGVVFSGWWWLDEDIGVFSDFSGVFILYLLMCVGGMILVLGVFLFEEMG